MQRYEKYSKVITATQGKRRYSTMYYPVPERKTTDIYVIARNNDRLDLMAQEYYGDPRKWVIIAKANKLHAGTIRVPPNKRIRIPFPLDGGEEFNIFTNKQF
jgi:nucleoid-associated protein YgaU